MRWRPHRIPGRPALLSLGVQCQRIIVQLVTAVFLARLLGPAGYGAYSFAWALILFVQVLPAEGLGTALVRFASLYYTTKAWAKLKGLWRFGFVLAVFYGALAAGTVVCAVSFTSLARNNTLPPGTLLAATFPLLVLPLVAALGATLRGMHRRIVGQLPEFAIRPIVFLLVVAIAFESQRGDLISPTVALWVQGIAALCAMALGMVWLSQAKTASTHENHKAAYESQRWIGSALSAGLAGGLMLLSNQADILVLGALSTARVVGEYRVASQGANLLATTLIAANLLIAPRISALHGSGDRAAIQRLLRTSVWVSFSVALPLAVTFWTVGPWLLLTIFGARYTDAYAPLAILCLGQLFNVGFGSVGIALNMTGHESMVMRIAAVTAVANIGLNWLLIPRYGGVGAAFATTVTMLTWNAMMAVALWRKTGLLAPLAPTWIVKHK